MNDPLYERILKQNMMDTIDNIEHDNRPNPFRKYENVCPEDIITWHATCKKQPDSRHQFLLVAVMTQDPVTKFMNRKVRFAKWVPYGDDRWYFESVQNPEHDVKGVVAWAELPKFPEHSI